MPRKRKRDDPNALVWGSTPLFAPQRPALVSNHRKGWMLELPPRSSPLSTLVLPSTSSPANLPPPPPPRTRLRDREPSRLTPPPPSRAHHAGLECSSLAPKLDSSSSSFLSPRSSSWVYSPSRSSTSTSPPSTSTTKPNRPLSIQKPNNARSKNPPSVSSPPRNLTP